MHSFSDKGLKGGISMVANPFTKANNLEVEGYDRQKPTRYIQLVDCNNQKGQAMDTILNG